MVKLFEERMEVCRQVAEYKIQSATKVLDRKREQEKLETVKALAHNDFNKHGVQELFQQIMAMSRKLQYQLLEAHGAKGRFPFVMVDSIDKEDVRVVYQGVEGAYSHQAMQEYFGEDVSCFHVETWRDAMIAIEEGLADYAVLPIENSTAGIVSEIYDLLVEFEHYIVGEQVIGIEHCLLGLPGASMEDIRRVYSHPQSLMQSAAFLNQHSDWQQVSLLNNAFAAQKVKEDGKTEQAAIAGAVAARIYGLDILQRGVNQAENNRTRFIIVSGRKIFREDAGKVSICFEIPHESGSLYHILSHFIYNDLNMTKIESRPIPERDFEYRFFIDFDGNLKDSGVKNALRGLREETVYLKVLGNY